jgi:enediyne biosynthesis protein E4
VKIRFPLPRFGLFFLFLVACGPEPETPPPAPEYARAPSTDYTRLAQRREAPQVTFTDITAEADISFTHETGAVGDKWLPETMGSGCALFDYDGDDYLDVLLINSTPWSNPTETTSKLYHNRGNGTFEDVTEKTGLSFSAYGMGVTAADYDADGDPDLYLTCVGDNRLLRNDGGRFTDVTGKAGVAGSQWTDDAGDSHPEWSTSAAWTDVDRDGWPDLFVANYVHWSSSGDIFTSLDGVNKSYATPQQYPGSTCRLYRNLGDGSFAEITKSAGVHLPHAKSMGVAVTDFESDGWPDLVVTNDTQPNFLLHNLGDGRFEERGLTAGIGYDESGRARAGMGIDIAPLTDDDILSIAVGNFSREPLSLYRQTGETFLDAAGPARLVQPTLRSLTFGLRFFDFDLDGRQDLVLANGHIEPDINAVQKEIRYAQAPQLFWNDADGQLLDVSAQTGGLFTTPLVARGLAIGDIDLDGDIDLLLTTNSGLPHLLRNDGPTGNSVSLILRGKSPALDGLGAVVTATIGDKTQRQRVRTGSSYLSHSDPVLHFGIGAAEKIDRMEIRWPDGSEEALEDLAAGSYYRLEQGKGIVRTEGFVR